MQYICNHENNVLSVTVHNVPRYISCHKANLVVTLFSRLHIYYAHLASTGFVHFVCRGSLMITYITLLALLVEHSLFIGSTNI